MVTSTDLIFGSIMSNGTITGTAFLLATLCSIVIGVFIAFMYTIKNSYSKSYIITLALLPAIVQVVIMLVNGNIGAGVAVAGAFSLVRFRSAPGSGKEITSIFLAMAVGLATGMGYIGIAALFAVIITLANLILSNVSFGNGANEEKTLKITVPEGLDFEGIFDDIFERYTTKADLVEVKTSGMGSLYKLNYSVVLRSKASTKGMIDEMRQRNGNLEISCSRPVAVKSEEL
ncbi:MAG: DUF4956 domain-containing protein [Butyrivibrio sp.]|nr:DUF4956 domain-containing protein [Butyrivibrio sp.]MBE5823218.1 DUF4956 domain-containing protein [Butyrivibrio sp.]MBR1641983.1 DUF4956 domain-containing protein [Butyrivibrio sp.]